MHVDTHMMSPIAVGSDRNAISSQTFVAVSALSACRCHGQEGLLGRIAAAVLVDRGHISLSLAVNHSDGTRMLLVTIRGVSISGEDVSVAQSSVA